LAIAFDDFPVGFLSFFTSVSSNDEIKNDQYTVGRYFTSSPDVAKEYG
jgi:hypothetical protein